MDGSGEALDAAVTLLAARDRTRAALARRLAVRGFGEAASAAAVDSLSNAGYVDDERFARRRAEVLAARGLGDGLIRHDLERHEVPADAVEAALCALEPERARVDRIVAARGRTARTLRLLAARGFAEESVERLIADVGDGAVG